MWIISIWFFLFCFEERKYMWKLRYVDYKYLIFLCIFWGKKCIWKLRYVDYEYLIFLFLFLRESECENWGMWIISIWFLIIVILPRSLRMWDLFLFFIFIFFRVGGLLPFLGSFSLTLRSLYNFYSLIKTCARALPPLLCTYAALSISSESML